MLLSQLQARGETWKTAVFRPPLTVHTAACAPLWRLYDGEGMGAHTSRQARALCARCGVRTACTAPLPRATSTHKIKES